MREKIAAIVRFTFAPDAEERIAAVIDSTLATTRTFAGCERIDILRSPERPDEWTLYEVWTDAAMEQAYRDFRASPEGADADLAALLAEPPTLERFTVRS
ncbi:MULTISPECIES: putative quinol monooxygenase [unclassified Microbacterium]|uniref:putative quinol monooxygenase n=1 Tax=unclassified Microbacterium TaxID=2609290 RepID=UPI000B34B83A|nr:antibiotic biosynthesis monooxygenase family protein [Microbacterium sp. JB110]RCS57225.1 antibiotic biosynthesis monooxygenase [Microbacterium sp. JB110]